MTFLEKSLTKKIQEIQWLSAYLGSNPSLCIALFNITTFINYYCSLDSSNKKDKGVKIDNHTFTEELNKLLERIQRKSEGAIIVVEGLRDKQALKRLGVDADFFLLQCKKQSLQASAEDIARNYKEALLMLDYDQKGKALTKKMVNYLQKVGVKVNTKLGRALLIAANKSTIESL